MQDCVFCRIAKKVIPAEFENESEKVVAFKDKNPIADIHILVVPKLHISSFLDLDGDSREVLSEMIEVIKDLIRKKGIEDKYRVFCNGGSLQWVPHLHFHLLGGSFKGEAIQH